MLRRHGLHIQSAQAETSALDAVHRDPLVKQIVVELLECQDQSDVRSCGQMSPGTLRQQVLVIGGAVGAAGARTPHV